MRETIKQHYVPEVYLDNFAHDDNGNVFALSIKSFYDKVRVRSVNKSGICYERHIYRMETDKVLKDIYQSEPNYIEKNLFTYENRFIGKISDRFQSREDINTRDAEKWVKTLLSLKQRNRVFKEQMTNPKLVNYHIEKEVAAFCSTMESKVGEEVGSGIFDQLSDVVRGELKPEVMNDFFRSIVINVEEGQDENFNIVVKQILKSRFLVCCAPEENPFITCDNPGFVMHRGDKVENIRLANAQAFAFPVSPTRLFVISPRIPHKYQPIIRTIQYINVDQSFIAETNKATMVNCGTRIIANRKDVLERIQDQYHKPFIESRKVPKQA